MSSPTESMEKPASRVGQKPRWFLRKRFIVAVLLIIALAIGLGVGLGIGLKKQSSSQSTPQCTTVDSNPVQLSQTPPADASQQIAAAFLSYAIEFHSFPSFAGNSSSPGIFSDNLLNNIGNLTGTKPYIRVGGNTQDQAIYNSDIHTAVTGKQTTGSSSGPSTMINIGNSFFESYSTWPNVKFIHGFNMGYAAQGSVGMGYDSLQATIPLACQALSGGKLLYWEYGNEPNLYSSSQGRAVAKRDWDTSSYISQWQNGTAAIQAALSSTSGCESMASGSGYGYIAPSLWYPSNSPITLDSVWSSGLDSQNDIKLVAMHVYGGNSVGSDVTIASTLLNHTWTSTAIDPVLQQYKATSDTSIPFIISETNSLYDTGIPGVTDTLAGALYSLDFALSTAVQNVTRIHFQQGDGFAYNSWQPHATSNTTMGTKPPYYGNLAAAAALGNSTSSEIKVSRVDLGSGADPEQDAAYAIYQDGALARLSVLNMREWSESNSGTRSEQQYSFTIPSGGGNVAIQRLLGPGSDATSGVSWDGSSYDVTPNNGLASAMGNVTTGEVVAVCNGSFSVSVQDSSAVVLTFES